MALPGLESIPPVIGSGIALVGTILKAPWWRKADPKEQYRFTKEFLADVEANKDMPSFLKVMGYRALVGGAKIDSSLVECTIKVKNYSDALADCTLGHQFLEATSDCSRLSFKHRYETKALRRSVRIWCYAGYVLFYSLATSPVWLNVAFGSRDPQYLWTLVLTVPAFVPLSWWSLAKGGVRLRAAERLIDKQKTLLDGTALPVIG